MFRPEEADWVSPEVVKQQTRKQNDHGRSNMKLVFQETEDQDVKNW